MTEDRQKWTDGGRYKMSDGREIRDDQFDQRFQVPLHMTFRPEVVRVKNRTSERTDDSSPAQMLAKPPAWTRPDTPCVPPRDLDPDVARKHMDQWDITPRGNQVHASRQTARALCAACPVTTQCLTAALEEERNLDRQYRYLVRGGLLPQDRATLDRHSEES